MPSDVFPLTKPQFPCLSRELPHLWPGQVSEDHMRRHTALSEGNLQSAFLLGLGRERLLGAHGLGRWEHYGPGLLALLPIRVTRLRLE